MHLRSWELEEVWDDVGAAVKVWNVLDVVVRCRLVQTLQVPAIAIIKSLSCYHNLIVCSLRVAHQVVNDVVEVQTRAVTRCQRQFF